MRKKKIQMPQTQAGLVRYYDDYKETVQIKPEHVVFFTAGIIVLELLLKFYA